jgi:predicted DNA-binding ribbon-helix-helix protein
MVIQKDKNNNNSNNGTVNFSSRLNKDFFSVLEKEALSKNISINSLVNNILGKYVSLDRHAQDIELISLTKRAVTNIFNGMEENKITQLSLEVGGVVHRELVFLKFDEMTFDNLMYVLVINASRYGSVKHTSKDSKHNICIHHGTCMEFSNFLSKTHEIMADHLSIRMSSTNIDQNTICMEFYEP